jgi:hypothetical protein
MTKKVTVMKCGVCSTNNETSDLTCHLNLECLRLEKQQIAIFRVTAPKCLIFLLRPRVIMDWVPLCSCQLAVLPIQAPEADKGIWHGPGSALESLINFKVQYNSNTNLNYNWELLKLKNQFHLFLQSDTNAMIQCSSAFKTSHVIL